MSCHCDADLMIPSGAHHADCPRLVSGPSAFDIALHTPFAAPRLGDPDWLAAHGALLEVHAEKSGGYGTGVDRLANFTAVAASSGRPAYLYPLDRITEKITRCYSLQAQGRTDELAEELTDIASLALCAEALRRRTDV